MAISLNTPKIEENPQARLKFKKGINGKSISEPCTLVVTVTFEYGTNLNCRLKVDIPGYSEYYQFYVDDSFTDEIIHDCGRVNDGYQFEFEFSIASDETIDDLQAIASPFDVQVTVYDMDNKGSESADVIFWDVI